ncbi:MAG: transcriptional regulator [Clostridiales bacterium]|nr:transcriptional regulator [Clostridiales bacterium]
MRRLTFAGYLNGYVRALSSSKTNSLYKLANEVPQNHRLREPLLLYALSIGKGDVLLKAITDSNLRSQYSNVMRDYDWSKMISALEIKDARLDNGYHKAYHSYVSRRNMPETNAQTKVLMWKKIRRLQEVKGVSNYRLYTDLHLNPSNINAFLKHGGCTKVSLDTARKMIGYLESV